MKHSNEIDIYTLLPTKRRMLCTAVIIVLVSMLCGMLLGWLVYLAPHGALARLMGDLFVAGGAAVFSAPGSEMLALWAGMVWGGCITFVAAFVGIGWLIVRVTRGYHELAQERHMDAYRRAISGKQPK